MSEPIIRVENLSKSYVLKHQQQEKYIALRDVISNKAKNIFTKSSQRPIPSSELFWALKDINFEVKQGDRIGIIGRNGAGKSTLLKILSRITEPTTGTITIDGRVASLLEVGTGFHPELTGRENIFLNGAILGMSKAEIKNKFDEIVAFAEVEKFLDTPVKRYSSGMYVRLAFAVAAHLEPEILIVDEVLAVGDAQFQKKCLGKMEDVSKNDGRTLLFVSHNMAAIQNLCDKVIFLEKGKIQFIGTADDAIKTYLKSSLATQGIDLADRKDRTGNGAIRFKSVHLKDANENNVQALHCGSKGVIGLTIERKNNSMLNNLQIAMGIDDDMGQRVTHLSNEVTNQPFSNIASDVFEIHINKLPLKHGRYSFTLFSTVNGEIADYIFEAGTFDVEAGDFFNTGKLPPEGQGSFYMDHSFHIK